MADIALSSKSQTASFSSGYVYIINPDASSPTGYTGFRISILTLHSVLNSLISANTADITTNEDDITALQEINTRSKFPAQVSSFLFAQPANSKITCMSFRNTDQAAGTKIYVSKVPSGDVIIGLTELGVGDDNILELKETFNSRAGQTFSIQVTGTIDVTIYYTKNEF